ncbi:hypothetical protein MMC07_006651 [Pseudocyphellaria aurata]|nr:hypothetical protein [Pseudocyphellaria aurata]
MASSTPSSSAPSRISTPNPPPPPNPRFTSQASTAEDLLKSQTVGLVHLSDFRKRRAEALEQKEREAQGGSFGRFATATPASTSGAATPSDGVSTPQPPKKKRKQVVRGKLSFRGEDEEEGGQNAESATSASGTPRSNTPDGMPSRAASPGLLHPNHSALEHRRLGPNSNVSIAPKALTKSALLREAQAREQLRKEFLSMQEAVKATEILIPFVFYDGTNIPGGACKVKKGDYVWLFLDRSRKLGAELGVGGGEKTGSRRDWARVGVDDLMLVRGEIIIPHHYELYYFIVNKTLGPTNIPLFDYASTLPAANAESPSSPTSSPSPSPPPPTNRAKPNPPLSSSASYSSSPSKLEGAGDDPNFTKVVDRRWYERNKHIFPASVWESFDPGKDYSKGKRTDAEGNAFFFS